MTITNYIKLEFPSYSANESFARAAAAGFAAQLDPTLEELGDIKTAVSEAVTNCIVHAYPDSIGKITMRLPTPTVLRCSAPATCSEPVPSVRWQKRPPTAT